MDACVEAAVVVEEVDAATGRSELDHLTQDRLGISVEEFLARLDRGEYDDTEDDQILRLVMFAPFAR